MSLKRNWSVQNYCIHVQWCNFKLLTKQNLPWGCLWAMQILRRRTRNLRPLTQWMPLFSTSSLWYSTESTHPEHTKLELWRHNSLLPHTIHWWSSDIWVIADQQTRVGPGLGGTPLPLISGTCTQSTVLATERGECLPCSRSGKLGPHKEDPAHTLFGRGAPFKTNKQTNVQNPA